MLIVILVMALILGLLAQYGPPKSRWLQTKGAAQTIAGDMMLARGQAVTSGQPVPLRLPPLPAWLGVRVEGQSPLVFEPDGSSSGGGVVLDDSGRRIAISADWLTGRVSVTAQ